MVVMLDRLIVLEGIDRSGKGTQAKKITEFLQSLGHRVWSTYEPTHQGVGAEIREVLRKEQPHPGAAVFQEMMAEDRYRHVQKMMPALADGGWVVCDRYLYSSLAYGMAEGVGFAHLLALNSSFPRPRLAMLIDTPVKTAMSRVEGAGELYERSDFLARVHHHYMVLLREKHDQFPELTAISGEGSPDEVFHRLRQQLIVTLNVKEVD